MHCNKLFVLVEDLRSATANLSVIFFSTCKYDNLFGDTFATFSIFCCMNHVDDDDENNYRYAL